MVCLGKAQCQNAEDSSRDAGGSGLTFALLCSLKLLGVLRVPELETHPEAGTGMLVLEGIPGLSRKHCFILSLIIYLVQSACHYLLAQF